MRYVMDLTKALGTKAHRFVLRKAGPFIGPRGGKWADAAHTIPWDEEGQSTPGQPIPGKGKAPEHWDKLPQPPPVREHVKIAKNFLKKHAKALPTAKKELIALAGAGAEVKGRVKKPESALGKIIRKPKYGTADKLQDGTGLRVVHQTVDQVKATVSAIKDKYKVIEEDDYITRPNGNYRSYHLIVEGPEGLAMEVQVRTENQNKFADWAHDVYKPVNEVQAKYRDDPEVQAYEAKMAAYFWDIDNGREPTEKPSCTPTIKQAFGCL